MFFFILQILFGTVCRMSGEIMCSPVVSLVGFLKALLLIDGKHSVFSLLFFWRQMSFFHITPVVLIAEPTGIYRVS